MDRESFDRTVHELATAAGVRMNGVVIAGPEGIHQHDFTGRGFPAVDVRSISKVVVSLAVGAAIADGVRLGGEPLSLDSEVGSLLDERGAGRAHLRGVRLRHLLTNTTGHDEGFLFREDLGDVDRAALLPHVLSRPLVHPPGAHFAYSNAGWFLISVLVREELGTTLTDWVAAYVLRKLGIADAAWVRYGRYEAGATGLHLSAPDLLKVGTLLLDDGRYRSRRVVPPAWVAAMRTPAVRVSGEYEPPLRATGYGLGLWVCDRDVHYCDGAGGQFLVVVPRTRTVVVALADAGDTATVARCLRGAVRPAGTA